jgi:hypothetical protein
MTGLCVIYAPLCRVELPDVEGPLPIRLHGTPEQRPNRSPASASTKLLFPDCLGVTVARHAKELEAVQVHNSCRARLG